MSVALGSAYVNDFLREGRVLRVNMQVDAPARATPDALLSLRVRTASGAMVRVRGNAQEFHKVAAVGARHIPGGLVAKRRAGK